ncbi:MAG TPA: ABC transporter permease [Acidobacteriaceae bacterium]|jgi:predicted permease|nr:ABC transporter permease [Acidobacteriaceae bacterium]
MGLINRTRNLFHRERIDAEIGAELRSHIEMAVEDAMHAGMPEAEARRAARLRFGNPVTVRERTMGADTALALEGLWRDVKFALRQLRKSPGFAVTAVLTLALGIGANTGIFSLTRALLLQPLPVAHPSRLIRISLVLNNPGGAVRDMPLNSFMIDSLHRHATTISGIFGWTPYRFVAQQNDGPRIADGALVSGNTFEVLGVRPAVGRLLRPEDDEDGGGPDGWAAVLSYRYWQEHFGGDPSAVGRQVTLSDHKVRVVGVAPKGFEGVIVTARPDFYLPLHFEPVLRGTGSLLRMRGSLWLTAWARVRSGVSKAAAGAEIRSLFRTVIDETLPSSMQHVPVVEHAGLAVDSGSAGWSDLRNEYTRPLLLLQALVGVVLLVCCVNLAGLCLARAATREREFAIRTALGAARARLMRQILVESLLLAGCGGALAIAFSWVTDRYLLRFVADRQAAAALAARPDPALLAITGGCALACALLFGLLPAWMASYGPVEAGLRTSGKNQGHGSRRNLLARRVFVPAQMALTLGLVSVAAMLSSTVWHLRENSTGFNSRGVVLFSTDFTQLHLKSSSLDLLYRRIAARIGQMPGVESVSVAENTPLSGASHLGAFSPTGSPEPGNNPFRYETNAIGSDYFATLGIRMLAGRDFTGSGSDAGACVLNEAAARLLFPAGTALGSSVRQYISSMSTGTQYSQNYRVIGIVDDTRFTSLRAAPPPIIYLPQRDSTDGLEAMTLLIRARTQSEADAAYRRTLHELAPKSAVANPASLEAQMEDSIARENLVATLSEFFAGLALLLSGIGMYGLMASWVARRTAEIGVRMALGATRRAIVGLVAQQVLTLLAVGVAVGGGLALVTGHMVRAFLYEVSPASPEILLLSIAIVGAAAILAAVWPARRAASVDPIQALRSE